MTLCYHINNDLRIRDLTYGLQGYVLDLQGAQQQQLPARHDVALRCEMSAFCLLTQFSIA